MKIACLTAIGSLRGALLFTVLASIAGAQNQTWIRQFGSTSLDFLWAAAPDGAGGVYVAGGTDGSLVGPNAGGRDVWLAHYDGTGNQTWRRQFGTTADDSPGAAAPDGAGGVYIGGETGSSLGGPHAGFHDAWLARYDGTGNQTWTRQFGTAADDMSLATAPDGMGGVFVSGQTLGSLGGPNAGSYDAWLAHYDGLRVTRYCSPATSNSTGQPGELTATGSNTVAANNLTVEATQLVLSSFGFFLTSQMQGLVMQPGGSQGDLCLGGAIGRYVGPGQIQNSGSAGAFSLALDLTMVPTPTGFVAVQPGDTWNFTAWHRDSVGGSATSNFTDAVSVTFL